MTKPTSNQTNQTKSTESTTAAEVTNTTPPAPSESDSLPLVGAGTGEKEGATTVASEVEVQVELESPAIDFATNAKNVLADYAEGMGRLVQYDRNNATPHQTKLIGLVNEWVKSANDSDSGKKFFTLGRIIIEWFSKNIDGCAAPELIHRGLKEYGSPIKNTNDYGRWATLVALFYRIDGAAHQATLTGNEGEINNHFKDIVGIDTRFKELLAQGLREKRF